MWQHSAGKVFETLKIVFPACATVRHFDSSDLVMLQLLRLPLHLLALIAN